MTAEHNNNIPVPPKLDLTKEGILKPPGASQPPEEKKTEVPPPVIPRAEPVRPSSAEIKIKPPEAQERSQTMHISIPEVEEKPPVAPAQAALGGEAPHTPTIRAEPITPSVPKGTGAEAQTKRKTSRISLETVMATPKPAESPTPAVTPGATPPKTIRIRPIPASGTIKATGGVVITSTTPPSQQPPAGEKRKTSRISLDSAVPPEKVGTEPPKPASIPKTIQLKRPPTVTPVSGEVPPATPVEPEAEASAEGTPTKRKTIKVKRPGEQITLPTGTAHIPAPAAAAAIPVPMPADRPSWIWHVITIAAILVMGVVIYVLAAQAFGPNVSLTELSCWKEGPNLPWPGKIPPPVP
jgi:hypothetical protein